MTHPPRLRDQAPALLLLVAALLPRAAAARLEESAAASELKRLPIEELLAVEVTTASKRAESIGHTAAALSVLTREDIHRSGARTLAEALRLAGGVHVARFDSRTWDISARGMNAQTANKMLVLIDGRTVYTPLFSGVFWDVQVPMLEDVERIEVVRGPAATLWGANAVNGVINVITLSAVDTQGGLAYAGAGDEERAFGGARWGGKLGGGAYRVFAQYDHHDALALPGGASAEDPLRIAHGGFRADLPRWGGDLTLQGDLYDGSIGHKVFGDTDVDGGDLQARWRRTLPGGSELEVRWFYDHTFRDVPGQFRESRDTVDLEAQQRWRRGRHDLLLGAGHRRSRDEVGSSPIIAFDPAEETATVSHAFAQDHVTLGAHWRAEVGLRVEDQSTMKPQLLPALTLAYEPIERTTLWAGAARAVRAPTRIDRDVRVPGTGAPFVVGSRDFRPEVLDAYELGARLTPLTGLVMQVAAFYNDYDRIRSQEPSGPAVLPLVIGNGLRARTRGLSLGAGYQAASWAQIRFSTTLLRTDVARRPGSQDATGGASEANDPRHYEVLRGSFDLPLALELDAALRRVGRIDVPGVPGYTELDLRLARRLARSLELALVGQNLLHDRHPEFGPATTREEVQRGVYGQVTWTF